MGAFAALLTPFDRGNAIEMSSKLWRKRVLPVGDISYQGRTLHFTPHYLQGLANAFNDKAYDQVSFQLADAGNTHTNDPERHRGTVVGFEAEPDGLWMVLDPTERGEAVLRENPYLGVSARIVEQYQRADGKFYPAAIQHVLGTLDPRIPGLGAWQTVEAANTPSLVIDLTGSSYAGQEVETMPELNAQQQANLNRLLNLDPAALDRLLGAQAPSAPPAPNGNGTAPPMTTSCPTKSWPTSSTRSVTTSWPRSRPGWTPRRWPGLALPACPSRRRWPSTSPTAAPTRPSAS